MPSDADPIFAAMGERSKSILSKVLDECGVDVERFFGQADSDVADEELRARLGSVWAQHGRACALKAQWKQEMEEREVEVANLTANAYFLAGDSLGARATEAAKKHHITLQSPQVREAEEKVREASYMVGMCKAARKALENRVNTLQSINKLAVAQIQNSGVPFQAGEGGAGKV